MSAPVTTGENKVGSEKSNNALKAVVKHNISEEDKKACLNTSMYALYKQYPFYGAVLQVMNTSYSYMLPTAGVGFNADMKRYELMLNPVFFCKALNDEQRIAVLLHEIMHITHQHLIRVPFLKVSNHKRILLNIAGDMAINQVIRNLPRGCKECPPLEEQQKGSQCKNEFCCGFAIDYKDYFDIDDTTKKRTQWSAGKTMESYFEKLMERYEEPKDADKTKRFLLIAVADANVDVTATGTKKGKVAVYTVNGIQSIGGVKLVKDKNVLLPCQTNALDNGIYIVKDIGSPTSPAMLERHANHDGSSTGVVTVDDFGALKNQKKKAKPTGWVVKGTPKSQTDKTVDVDVVDFVWEEQEMQVGEGGQGLSEDGSGAGEGIEGLPRQFDSHDWGSGADENDILDATEDLVKRAMTKQSMSHDEMPGHVKDLLDDIKARRAELNYKALILAAIKRSATGVDRKNTWTKSSRRHGDDAPGLKMGELPKLDFHIDTSGSISIPQVNEFLGICDEFLKVGSRKCTLNLFSDVSYYGTKYRMGDRVTQDMIRKNVSMGGTCLESTMRQILKAKPDLTVVLTDGYYGDVQVEKWLKHGQKFPEILFIIEANGTVDHPLKRLGKTIKVNRSEKANGKK